MDYRTPPGNTLQRHLTSYLSKQIDFLNSCRPLAPSMKFAIRYLKNEVATISVDTPDEDVILFSNE